MEIQLEQSAEAPILSPEGFPVRTSPPQESRPDSPEVEAPSGGSSTDSSQNSDQLGHSLRTFLISALKELTPFSIAWKEKVTPAQRPWWVLGQSGRGTKEIESGFLPMPRANKVGGYSSPGFRPTLEQKVLQLLPTPRASEWKGCGPKGSKSQQHWNKKKYLEGVVKEMLPTPQARDYRTGQTSRWEDPRRSRNLNDKVGGKLNPTWVEWLMGYPLGWTDLKASVTL